MQDAFLPLRRYSSWTDMLRVGKQHACSESPARSSCPKLTDIAEIRNRFATLSRGISSPPSTLSTFDVSRPTLPLTPVAAPMNPLFVPILGDSLTFQIFPPLNSPLRPPPPTAEAIQISLTHLQSHGLASKKDAKPTTAVDFVLPRLQGATIVDHFHHLAEETVEPYLALATDFAKFTLPPMPDREAWSLIPGWSHYHADGSFEAVAYPPREDSVVVFDVETLPYVGGDFPVMAVAAGRRGWYGWCSPWLTGDSTIPNHLIPFDAPPQNYSSSPSTLFEDPSQSPRLLIGHNVLYDRARVASEYTLRRPANRWLDTQSLHVAVSGLTNPQRPAWMMHRKEKALIESTMQEAISTVEFAEETIENSKKDESVPPKVKAWQDVSSMNSLREVAKLHCGIEVDKSMRDVFIDPETTIKDVRENFKALMRYCATDVSTTHAVYQVLLPKFRQKCPHPASFSGILIMSQPILPVDRKWPQFLERAEKMYEERLKGCKDALHVLAEEARAKMNEVAPNGKFAWQNDLWLRQLDWSPKKARRLPTAVPALKRKPDKTSSLAPSWFSSLSRDRTFLDIPFHSPLAATLLRVTYRSFPVYFSESHGWLFGVPSRRSKLTLLPRELPVEFSALGPKDDRLRSIKATKLFTIPSTRAGARRNKLLTAKDVAAGLLQSEFDELALGMDSHKDVDSKSYQLVAKKLTKLAEEAVKPGPDGSTRASDPWLRQLDWSEVEREEYESPEAVNLEKVKDVDLVWPAWYHDLDRPRLGLDISIGKRAAPILLRLSWKGHPLAYSKEHGWSYRIPLAEAPAALAADQSLVPLSFTLLVDTNLREDTKAVYVKLPHSEGEEKSVGNPLSKSFGAAFEAGVLSSEYAAAKAALELTASCSYWASARERIMNQMVVWNGDATIPSPTPSSIDAGISLPSTQGIILPQVTPMGTVTRRAVERTWLTASNAKKNRVGSELKSMVNAPPGYAIVGADVDSEELWICSVMGDAQFGIHGATAIGWMTLEGTKSAGTDLHSKTAGILGISRDDAKVFNYSRIYGAGVKHATQLLLKANQLATKDGATVLAKNLYASTKGLVSRNAFDREFWHGGTESFVFNKLEEIAKSDNTLTPALGCGITDALTKAHLPSTGRNTFLPSRINWVVQSSGVDYLHLLLVSMEYLTKRFGIDARYMISVHDEVRYLVKEEDKYRAAMAMQISNLWTRALFSHRLQIADLPQVCPRFVRFRLFADLVALQSCAFFSAVDVDHVFRKEVNMTCLTPSNPDSIPFGESLDISDSLAKTSNGSLFADGRSMTLDELLVAPAPASAAPTVDGEQHRVADTRFLLAQAEKSIIAIRKLWKQSQGRSTTEKSTSRARSPDDDFDVGIDEMREAMAGSRSNPSLSRQPSRFGRNSWNSLKLSKRSQVALAAVPKSPLKSTRSVKSSPVVPTAPSPTRAIKPDEPEEDYDIPDEMEDDFFSTASTPSVPDL